MTATKVTSKHTLFFLFDVCSNYLVHMTNMSGWNVQGTQGALARSPAGLLCIWFVCEQNDPPHVHVYRFCLHDKRFCFCGTPDCVDKPPCVLSAYVQKLTI